MMGTPVVAMRSHIGVACHVLFHSTNRQTRLVEVRRSHRGSGQAYAMADRQERLR